MGFRFRKAMKILPGLRLNITKNGPNSLSVGGRGMTLNLGKKGTRTTVSAPGTGMSYSDYQKYEGGGSDAPQPEGRSINLWPILFGIACVAYAFFSSTR